MNLFETLRALEPNLALGVITGISVALYALASNLAWIAHQSPNGRLGHWIARLRPSRVARAIGEIARLLYYLALPWASLMLGYNTIRVLGVWGMDWISPLPIFVALTLGAAAVNVWVWRPYAREEHPRTIDKGGWHWARHIAEVIFQEAHWAFYRSGPIAWMAGNVYWGSFAGLLLTYIEGWSNPVVRTNVRDLSRADAPLWSGSIAIVSTIIFLFTQNVWYCLAAHLLLDLGLRSAIGFPRVHTPGEIPPSD